MKIAIPISSGILCTHFGHCEKFEVLDVDENSKSITGEEVVVPPPHEPGLLPKWLHDKNVNVIIAGGMGMRAQQLFQQYGIKVVIGAPSEQPQKIVLDWIKGALITGVNICDH